MNIDCIPPVTLNISIQNKKYWKYFWTNALASDKGQSQAERDIKTFLTSELDKQKLYIDSGVDSVRNINSQIWIIICNCKNNVSPFKLIILRIFYISILKSTLSYWYILCIGVVAIGTLGTWALPDKERNLSARNQKVFKYWAQCKEIRSWCLEGYHFQINACPCLLSSWNIPNSQLVSHFVWPNGCLSQMLY